jgi:hypothetical protein
MVPSGTYAVVVGGTVVTDAVLDPAMGIALKGMASTIFVCPLSFNSFSISASISLN